eukprot:CAMPEP_0204204558 /NCGR_PEP_ID=MMETSP0361-20130328/69713_1 /ASSEMBLY_ACC=CAM_ASM_000343 /TAXON_ID=268821 /ORGANISM="Scrippsiella Hangoei, Strain SHTV-5" /LENGTH=273 /DNA_ID=CAMNT_0051167679 /DNA_START=1 /DNA_END=822 /DNA_ORIENTATION=+
MAEAWRGDSLVDVDSDSLIDWTGRPGMKPMPTPGLDPLEGFSFESRPSNFDDDDDFDFVLGAGAWQKQDYEISTRQVVPGTIQEQVGGARYEIGALLKKQAQAPGPMPVAARASRVNDNFLEERSSPDSKLQKPRRQKSVPVGLPRFPQFRLRTFSDELLTSILPSSGLPSSMDPPSFRAKPARAREAWALETTSVAGADNAGGGEGRGSGGSGSGGSSSQVGRLRRLFGGRGGGVGIASLGFGLGSVVKKVSGHSNGAQSNHREDCSAEVEG